MINQFRISKYNPLFRSEKGNYSIKEWTDFSDIGKQYLGKVFSYDEYIRTEKRYMDTIMEVAHTAKIPDFSIENYEGKSSRILEKRVSLEAVPSVIKSVLRNEFWCELVSDGFFVHFGYDYYIYIGCVLSHDVVRKISSKHKLYCEEVTSPYYFDNTK